MHLDMGGMNGMSSANLLSMTAPVAAVSTHAFGNWLQIGLDPCGIVFGAGTLYGTDKNVSVAAGQERTWEVGHSLTGGIKLSEA